MAMSTKNLRLIHKSVQHISKGCEPRELYFSFFFFKKTYTEYSVIKDINVTHQTKETKFSLNFFKLFLALVSLYEINTDKYTHILLKHHFINTKHYSVFQPLQGYLQGV